MINFDDYTLARTAWAIHEAGKPGREGLQWQKGKRLRLLFAGYNGARNTGSDVRVEEMLRQVRHVLGDKNVELSVLTINPKLSRGYFKKTLQLTIPAFFPPHLEKLVAEHHGAVACEGSMFKSNFGNSLSALMAGVLGVSLAQKKPAVGYGAEAGKMDPLLRQLVKRSCKEAYVLTRNEKSRGVLAELGIQSELGTDTAWTFEPAPAEAAQKLLREAGWDGVKPVLVVCPMNPFWWPLRPSLARKALLDRFGWFKDSHARTIYFHNSGAEIDRLFATYLDGLATGIKRFTARQPHFVAVVGMEALDRPAVERLGKTLGAATFASDQLPMYETVALLRQGALMVTSRFHAAVCSMPGLVPSIAVSMDERLENLLTDRGHPELVLSVREPELGAKLEAALDRAHADRERIVNDTGKAVARNLRMLTVMGRYFDAHIRKRYPDLAPVARGEHWSAWLPPLSPTLTSLVERFDAP